MVMIDAVLRAARILQATPGYSMPLVRLHAQLVRELGPQAGSYGEIYQQLKKRTDSFVVVDAARMLEGAELWPGIVREAYDSVLETAGFGSCVRVSLTATEEGEPCALLAALSATMADLIRGAAGDATLQVYVERAAQELAELNRIVLSAGITLPTTPLRGLPPAE
jgi:hypothetical protein